MQSQYKFIILAILFPILTGCREELNYTYLMQHPVTLKEEVMRCESNGGKSTPGGPTCDLVMRAANDFTSIISEQQENPEKFGQRILDAETDCVKAKDNVDDVRQSLVTLKNKHASATELQPVQEKLDQTAKIYQEKKDEVKVLLAVAGLNSPE